MLDHGGTERRRGEREVFGIENPEIEGQRLDFRKEYRLQSASISLASYFVPSPGSLIGSFLVYLLCDDSELMGILPVLRRFSF